MAQTQLKALFLKIGGEPKVKQILRDFYQKMSQDILIGYFFDGKNIQAIADTQLQFLLFAAGLTSQYSGKLPTSAHLEMPPILRGHFDRRLILLQQILKENGLTEEDVETWIQFENAFRGVIVQDEKTSSNKP